MSSKLKRETARTNGAKSHGPVTPEGKARSAANSRRHGLAAAAIVLPGESAEHFQLLLADYMDQFQPQTGVEADLVEVMAVARWRLRRLLAIETCQFDLELARHQKEIDKKFVGMEHADRLAWVFQDMSDNGNSLALVLRYEASINRSYDKALKQLHQFQSSRPPVPPSVPPADPVGSFGNREPDAPSNQEPVPAMAVEPPAHRITDSESKSKMFAAGAEKSSIVLADRQAPAGLRLQPITHGYQASSGSENHAAPQRFPETWISCSSPGVG